MGGALLRDLRMASNYTSSTDAGQRILGGMLADIGDELSGLVGRTNPEAGERLSRARNAWADFVRIRRASAAAGGRPFSPAQFEAAVKQADDSVGRGATARNQARMQDLSRAAREVMPDAFGNSPTADVGGYTTLGLLTGANVPAGMTVAGALSAAAIPYMMMGRRVIAGLPKNPSRQEAMEAQRQLGELAKREPKVRELQRELSALIRGAREGSSITVSGQVANNRPQPNRSVLAQ